MQHKNNNLLRSALLALLFILSLVAFVSGDTTVQNKIQEIMTAEMKYDTYSGNVLIAKDGNTIYVNSFGEADNELNIPNKPNLKFNVGSVQKPFIATLIMMLHQEGALHLDDSLNKYYPECPFANCTEIKIKHLLNHTGGLSDYRNLEEYQNNSEQYSCIDDVIPVVFKQEPLSRPGERFKYSNSGYLLLKGILEKASGMKWGQLLEERILKPLKMSDTKLYIGGDKLENRSMGHCLSDDATHHVRVTGEPSAYAGGGLYTTVEDLLKFDRALNTNQLLDEKAKSLMFTPAEASPYYGYGWFIVPFGGATAIYHGGATTGFSAEFRRYPEAGYTLILLSNYENAAYNVANRIDCMLLDDSYEIVNDTDVNFERGLHLEGKKYFRKAIEFYQKNIEGEKPHFPSLYHSARSRILGEFDQLEAIRLLDIYINTARRRIRPSISDAWLNKGFAYEQLGNVEQAINCCRKSLELDQDNQQAKEAIDRLEGGK